MKKGLLNDKSYWFKDIDGNIYYESENIPEEVLKTKPITYHSRFVSMLTEKISEYKDGKFIPIGAVNTTYNSKLAIAMTNSGDYTFDEAVQTIVDCCERCLNILYNKYLSEKNYHKSYLYNSWDRPCKFCDPEDDKYFEILN